MGDETTPQPGENPATVATETDTAANTPTETPRNPLTIAEDIKDRREVIKEAMSKIRSLFEAKTMNIQTNRAEVCKIAILGLLTAPLGEISENWKTKIEHAPSDEKIAELNARYKPKVEEVIKITDGYLNKMTAATGFLTPEIMVKIQTDLNKKAAGYADLLEDEANRDVLEAYKWSIGDVDDKLAARPKALETLKKRIPEEFSKGDRGLMPVLWGILAQLDRAERLKIVKECEIPNLQEFVMKGIGRGVFPVDEAEELLDKQFSREERENYAALWTEINDKRKEALALTMSSYGAENPANKMLTLGNIGLTFLQFLAGTTMVGNIVTDIFQGGKTKSMEGIVKAIIKPHNLVAGGALAAINIYRKGSTWKQELESKGSRETHKEAMALTRLGDLMRINAAGWPAYEEALTADDCAGIKAISDYSRELKRIYEKEELEQDLSEHFDFQDYLARKSKEEKPERALNYAKLQEFFEKFKDKEKIFELAKIFDSLNFGGEVTVDEYHKLLAKAKNYPEDGKVKKTA